MANRSIRDGDNPELLEERRMATFDTDKMAAVIYGSEEVRTANYKLLITSFIRLIENQIIHNFSMNQELSKLKFYNVLKHNGMYTYMFLKNIVYLKWRPCMFRTV